MKLERLLHTPGISLDGPLPITVKNLPTERTPGSDGMVQLYSCSGTEKPDRVTTVEKPGRMRVIDDPKDPEDPFVFVEGGYSITCNNYTGEYAFTINPEFDVDFDFIERQSEDDKRALLLRLLYMAPSVSITNDNSEETSPQLQIKINRNKLKLFTASPGTHCSWNTDEMSSNFREVADRFQVIGRNKNITYISGPMGDMPFSVYVTADISKVETPLQVLLGNYAQTAEKDPPSKREIAQIASAKIHLVEKDPFEGVLF